MDIPVYAPVGRCIYCRTASEKLGDEHIIPYALNGRLILPKASCNRCAQITGRIEHTVLRIGMKYARAVMDLQTRRPSERPETAPLELVRGGQRVTVEAPLADQLITLNLPIYKLPAVMREESYYRGIEAPWVQSILLRPDPNEVLRRHGAERFATPPVQLDAKAFALMLAKIAYSFAVAHWGLDTIKEGYVVPAILGERDDIGRWVGSSPKPFRADETDPPIMWQVFEDQSYNPPRKRHLIVIRLFTTMPSPGYVVLVGGDPFD